MAQNIEHRFSDIPDHSKSMRQDESAYSDGTSSPSRKAPMSTGDQATAINSVSPDLIAELTERIKREGKQFNRRSSENP